jgi:hypothetical protein
MRIRQPRNMSIVKFYDFFCTLPGLFMMVSGGVVGAGSGGTGELTARKVINLLYMSYS